MTDDEIERLIDKKLSEYFREFCTVVGDILARQMVPISAALERNNSELNRALRGLDDDADAPPPAKH